MQAGTEVVFKLLLIGNPGVGKSAFLLKHTDNVFPQQYLPTIGVDFKLKSIDLNGQSIKLQIWDTAGQERFINIITSYFKGANGILLIYDVTDKESFNDIQKWLEKIQNYANSSVLTILVGNKSDLNNQRQVTVEEGQNLANDSGMLFIETSAKEGYNVEHAFNHLVAKILAQHEKGLKPQQE